MTNTQKASRYPVTLIINGTQLGDDSTFADWGQSAEQVAKEQAEFFRSEGFATVETEVTDGRIYVKASR